MTNKELVFLILGITYMLFILFLTIVHFIRRNDLTEKGSPELKDYKEINVVGTIMYFCRKMKERRNRKSKSN
jgi:hypothetical protein